MVECVSDFKMPEKVVSRLLKDSLPDNVSISKDAKNAACRSASIFILQLSIGAAEKAQENNRSTLDNQDIIRAVTDLGLGEYASQLVRFGAQRKRNAKRKESNTQKVKPSKKLAPDDGTVASDNFDPMDGESYDMSQEHGNDFDSGIQAREEDNGEHECGDQIEGEELGDESGQLNDQIENEDL